LAVARAVAAVPAAAPGVRLAAAADREAVDPAGVDREVGEDSAVEVVGSAAEGAVGVEAGEPAVGRAIALR